MVLYLEQELDEAKLIGGDNHDSPVAHGRHWQLQLCLFISLHVDSHGDNIDIQNSGNPDE